MPAPLRFMFDFVSPYSYLAWTQAAHLAEEHGRELEPVPVLLAALLDAHGQRGPAEIAAKRAFTYADVVRKASALGVPISPPASHPFNPLLPLRVATVAMDRVRRTALIHRLFTAAWVEGREIGEATCVSNVAESVGLDGKAVLAAAGTPEVKSRLRSATTDAIAAGVFGVPTFIVDGEVFWGLDSVPWVAASLRGEDPMTAELREEWNAVRPSATRRAAT